MKGKRPLVGAAVKCGFLTLYVVGHVNNGRLVRDAAGTKFYWQINYGGLHAVDLDTDGVALTIMRVAADLDPIVNSFLNNIRRAA